MALTGPGLASAQKLDKEDKKFLDDVRPILLAEEDKTYKGLKEKGDRLEFQKIFWARRVPDLATPANEYQAEYEKARAEADRLYRIPAQAGSLTDCGRVFILLGKPDEVQQETGSLTPGLRAPEVWTYRDRPGRTFTGGKAAIALAHFSARPDLVMTGRTLLGRSSTRGQQFEDHYFGSIPARVLAFMEEMEFELHRLGVPVRTRHNEVAPMQFEMAPIFEDANLANDHNALAMDIMRKVALRHHFVCVLHEKPYAGINGSGKHCNWSMGTDRGENLLDPGRTPHQNLRFLAFIAVCLKAVHDHADVLRWSISGPNNDLRVKPKA